MLEFVRAQLNSLGIELFAPIPLDKCDIIRPYKLENNKFNDFSNLSAIMIAIPYYTENNTKNISSYAISQDYHLFCDQTFQNIIPALNEKFAPHRFCGYADSSPINERSAAAMAGLGIIGDNMMLITEKYSSFVFIAEIITDYPIDYSKTQNPFEIKGCCHCGACSKQCPMNEIGECLSSVTQKKGELSDTEKQAILKYGSAWGCDICQDACPYTKSAISSGTIYTNIDFFKENRIARPTAEIVENMDSEEFKKRAYSWRGKNPIIRNLRILENKEN